MSNCVSRVVVVQPWLEALGLSIAGYPPSHSQVQMSLPVPQLTVQSLAFLTGQHHLLALTDKLPPGKESGKDSETLDLLSV